jgi:hypothetical protein
MKIPQNYLLCSLSSLLLLITTPMVSAGWEVQWIDTFEGTGVDWSNWTAQTQANYNAELQCYTDDDMTGERNYEVSNGTLKIIARKQAPTTACPGLGNAPRTWTSGRLNSKDKAEFSLRSDRGTNQVCHYRGWNLASILDAGK